MMRLRRHHQPASPEPASSSPPSLKLHQAPSSSSPARRIRHIAAIVVCGLVAAGWMHRHRCPERSRRRLLPPRFPRYGSPAFAAACQWAVDGPTNATSNQTPNPSSLVPHAIHSEGLSSWVSAVAQAYIHSRHLARQNHGAPPQLLLDFEGINISQVVLPPETRRDNPGWAAAPHKPKGAVEWCKKDHGCTTINEAEPGRFLVPRYRNGYSRTMIREGDYDHLIRALPGFSVETGMACALGSMLEPSPKLADHEPGLFAELLPQLRDDGTLVLSLYLRTGWTDIREPSRRKAGSVKGLWNESADRQIWEKKADEFIAPFVDCAQKLERDYFANYSHFSHRKSQNIEEEGAYSKIVWLVSSDSPLLKEYVRDTFGRRDVSVAANETFAPFSIPRHVLYTAAQGKHTKHISDPNLVDVAQAFVDWYAMGESDAVLADISYFSFGATAAMRTARPVYYVPTARPHNAQKYPEVPRVACTRQVMVHSKRSTKGDAP